MHRIAETMFNTKKMGEINNDSWPPIVGVTKGNPKDSVWEDWGTEQETLGKIRGITTRDPKQNPINPGAVMICSQVTMACMAPTGCHMSTWSMDFMATVHAATHTHWWPG